MENYDQKVSNILKRSGNEITESDLNYLRRAGAVVSAPLQGGIALIKLAVKLGMMAVKADRSGRFDDNGRRIS